MAHRRPGENERTRHDVRRGVLSAGGFITGSSGGAAIGRCKPAVASGWKPASADRRSECRAETACWLCSRQPCPKGDAQSGHFLWDNQHSRKKKKRHKSYSRKQMKRYTRKRMKDGQSEEAHQVRRHCNMRENRRGAAAAVTCKRFSAG